MDKMLEKEGGKEGVMPFLFADGFLVAENVLLRSSGESERIILNGRVGGSLYPSLLGIVVIQTNELYMTPNTWFLSVTDLIISTQVHTL